MSDRAIAWNEVNLHDATLKRLGLDWPGRGALIETQTHAGPVRIAATGFRRLSCSRDEPWGPSAQINEVREGRDAGDGSRCLEIEMQSGDVISLHALTFEVLR